MPEAMTGPAAIPLKKTTPKIVPKTSATVICGSEAINPTPLEDKTATSHRKNSYPADRGLKASNKSRRPISPVAIGIDTCMMISHILIPLT